MEALWDRGCFLIYSFLFLSGSSSYQDHLPSNPSLKLWLTPRSSRTYFLQKADFLRAKDFLIDSVSPCHLLAMNGMCLLHPCLICRRRSFFTVPPSQMFPDLEMVWTFSWLSISSPIFSKKLPTSRFMPSCQLSFPLLRWAFSPLPTTDSCGNCLLLSCEAVCHLLVIVFPTNWNICIAPSAMTYWWGYTPTPILSCPCLITLPPVPSLETPASRDFCTY